jgi:hypothetical protein
MRRLFVRRTSLDALAFALRFSGRNRAARLSSEAAEAHCRIE